MDRRTELLQCAYEIVGREGLEGLHARAIAQALQINHATVHYYFPTRNDLLSALVDYSEERYLADRDKILARADNPVTRLQAEVALFEAYCRPSSRFFRVWASLFVASQTNEDIRNKLKRFSQVWASRFGESKNLAGYATRITNDPFNDPYTFCATMLGLGMMAQLFQNQEDTSFKIDQLVSQMVSEPNDH
ncbi:MAG: TetR/AcrR family transcriptional regulator [Armatimonadetes bacterium]|nr:TetR/AcrR family transcriptional regulator [Armatimonadota bacterium]